MLFHTWPFAIFLLVVLPVFFALQKTRLWLPWLTAASYFFYGWWNPYYLLLVAYSTLLDYSLVALMDHCPRAGPDCAESGRFSFRGLDDALLKAAFVGAVVAALAILELARYSGPPTLRPTLLGAEVLMLLMAVGALFGSRRIWLLVSIVNNLALLLFFKYAGFLVANLNALFAHVHLPLTLADPATLMPFGFDYLLPVGISFFTFQSLSYTIDFYFGNVRARTQSSALRHLRLLLSPVDGRADRARPPSPAAVPKVPRRPAPEFHRRRVALPRRACSRKLALANYLSLYVERVYEHPETSSASALVLGDGGLRLADLLRLQRLHRHGARRRPAHGLQPDAQLQQPLPRHRPRRLLDPLAHQPLDLVQGLCLYPARRKPPRVAG